MAEITEVIHKISYEVNDEALENATKLIHQQIIDLEKLTRSLNSYKHQLASTSTAEVRQIELLGRKIEETNGKIARSSSKLQGVLQCMAMDYIAKQYSSDELMKRKAQLITELDELSILNTTEIMDLQATGAISDTQLHYSRKLPVAIDELIEEKGEYWFITNTIKNIKAALPTLSDETVFRVGLN